MGGNDWEGAELEGPQRGRLNGPRAEGSPGFLRQGSSCEAKGCDPEGASYGGVPLPPGVTWRSLPNFPALPNFRFFAVLSSQKAVVSHLLLGGLSPKAWHSFWKQARVYPGDPHR